MRNFREMTIWQEGINLVSKIYLLTELFPKGEEYGLKNQIRRAAVSIPSNIAEGCSRTSEKEFKHYLEISMGSSFEIETDIIIARKLKMIPEEDFKILLNEIHIQQRRMNALVTTIKSHLP